MISSHGISEIFFVRLQRTAITEPISLMIPPELFNYLLWRAMNRKSKGITNMGESAAKREICSSRVPHRRSAKEEFLREVLLLPLLLAVWGTWYADTFRVHLSVRGSGREITVQAESSSEARRGVLDLYPKALVTGVHRVKK